MLQIKSRCCLRIGLRWGLLGLLLTPFSGCVFLPATVERYDTQCQIHTRHVTLEPAVMQGMLHCNHQSCAALLVTAGVVTVASAVISGSIAIVGNVAYWMERQGRCQPANDSSN